MQINLWNCGNYYKVRVLRSIFENCGNSYKFEILQINL
ncbi:hypothetical protein LEP1GSC186_2693 [Leptospira noguchii serovar Autumnalis str. ZUN142]|uniref:Uncharacterized protein n=1 Tax=Leptospira noguchii serovar Autumnalis str. ZUN142 TaxID=1085540 RepID=M6UQ90_9LEPT|nr:hypothetical protein LEP1GSC186_2693 [Leptospira noguchii serovar Autumnalis str. ZUN142]